ncbi:MAG: hypothetical protein IMZ66_00795, partial [Planctomycetes bacterium]|nr:hypothetical protein [Planctomycetota bacterium]
RPRDPPGRRAFCLEANIPVRRPDPHADLAGLLGVHFNVVRRGYGWVFHHGSYYSVGLGALGSSLDRPLEAFRRFVADRGLSLDGVRVRGHMVPCGGVRRQVVADRLLLAGDAAGFVDPILWEGISYAIRSGQLAADAAMDAAGRGDLSRRGLAPYARLCHDAFGRDLRIARLLRQLAHYWPARGRMPGDAATEVFRRYLHLSFEDDTYRDFLWWLIRRAPGLWLRSVWPQRSGGAPL